MPTTLSSKALAVKSSSTLEISAKAKALKSKGIDVVTFGAGEPDFPTPENICNAAIKAIKEGKTKYTAASGIPELKKAVSDKFKEFNHVDYSPEQIVISNGGKQTLHNIFTAIINAGDEVIVPVPYWLTYPEMIRLVDGVPVFLNCTKENNFKLTARDLQSAVTPRTKALVLNNPQNPTGALYTKGELEAIGKIAVENDFYIISDEIYEILNYSGKPYTSMASLSPEIYEKTITTSGVSKSYSMTGWRIGYSASSAKIAKIIGSIQSHQSSNPSSISQYAALEALTGPQDTVKYMAKVFESRRDLIYGRVSEMRFVSALKPQGAFYLFVDCGEVIGKRYKGERIKNISGFANILLDEFHVAVVPCIDFGMPDYIRLSYAASEEEITKGLDRIENFLNQLL